MIILKPEDKLILACIKIQPTQEEIELLDKLVPEVTDWEYVATISIDRGIGPLLHNKISLLSNNNLIPKAIKHKLQQSYYITFSRSVYIYRHFNVIAGLFALEGVKILALKGIYLSETLYKDAGLRQFSDIDLLVQKEDAEKSLAILSAAGYKAEGDKEDNFSKKLEVVHFSPMVLNGVSVEIHLKLHLNIEKYKLDISDLWETAHLISLNNRNVYVLSKINQLIHVCVHLDKHFHQGHIQFTGYMDITNLLMQFNDDADWKELIRYCEKYNCIEEVFTHILLANKYMQAKAPENIILKYNDILSEKLQLQFYDYFSGHRGFTSGIPKHFSNFQYLNNPSDKFIYAWRILFPSKAFMIKKFNIKHPALVLFYYPYRYFVGLKGVIKLIAGS